jgi:MFS family permease
VTASTSETEASRPPHPVRRQTRRATFGSFLGGTMEFYDFTLYATASALIFPTVFFRGVDPLLAVGLSYVTLAAGYVARPIGGLVIAHFGDRVGRKRMLILTMLVMGIASVLIGLVPGSAQIGVAAPIALVVLRVIQGFALGGEWAGASLMALEHSDQRRHGFIGSIVGSGGPAGGVLGTLVFALVSRLPADQLLDWGWRIPFLSSALIVVVALLVRSGLDESPEFVEQVAAAKRVLRLPLATTITENWRNLLLVGLGVLGFAFVQSLTATIGLSQAVSHGIAQSDALWMVTLCNFLSIPAVLLWGLLANRFGRLRAMLIGQVVLGVGIWAAFACWSVGTAPLLVLGFLIIQPIGVCAVLAPAVSYAAEMFPPNNRFTGVTLSYQGSVAIASGFAPLVSTALITAGSGSLYPLAACVSVLAALGIVGALASRRLYVGLNRRDRDPIGAAAAG